MPTVCKLCGATFENYAKLTYHKRKVHQQEINITVSGTKYNVVRDSDGQFACPTCDSNFENPSAFHRHARDCIKAAEGSNRPEADNQTSTESAFIGRQRTSQLFTSVEHGGDIVTTRKLEDIYFARNTRLKICICTHPACRHALSKNRFTNHAKEKHDLEFNATEYQKLIDDIVSNQTEDTDAYIRNVPPTPLPPVEGIAIQQGWRCQHCSSGGYYGGSEGTMRTHNTRKHPAMDLAIEKCTIQSLYRDSRRKFFGISVNETASSDNSSHLQGESRALAEDIKKLLPSNRVRVSTDPRDQSAFANTFGILEAIQGHSVEKIKEFLNINKEPRFKKLATACVHYVTNGNKLITKVLYTLRRNIKSTNVQVLESRGFEPLQERSSMSAYGRYFAQLLAMLIRGHTDLEFIPLLNGARAEPELSTAIVDLNSALESVEPESREFQVAIHRALMGFFCRHMSMFTLRNQTFIFTFICYSAVKKERIFCEPGTVTSNIAKLQHVARLGILEEICGGLSQHPRPNDERARQLLLFLKDNTQRVRPFGILCELMKLAATFAYAQENRVAITWTTGQVGRELKIDGTVVHADHLRHLVRYLINDADTLLHDTLLMGMRYNRKMVSIDSSTVDIMGSLNPGYWFIDESQNKFKLVEGRLIDHICNSEILKRRFIRGRLPGGRVDWNPKALKKFLTQCSKLCELLLVLAHITGGQPARAPELETLKLCNGANFTRSFFVLNGRIMIMNDYHKARSVTGRDRPVPRVLPREVSNIFVRYLSLVRPFETIAAQTVYGNEVVDDYCEKPWMAKGKPFSAERIRTVFGLHCIVGDGEHLLLSQYRHVAIAFGRHLGLPDAESIHNKSTSFFDAQAAHSTQTAELYYGGDSADPLDISPDSIAKFEQLSLKWHEFLGFKEIARSSKPRAEQPAPVVVSPSELRRIENASPTDDNDQVVTMQAPAPRQTINRVRMVELRGVLRQFLKSRTAEFKSKYQAEAIAQTTMGKDLAVILPTGGGKSLVWMLPVYIEPKKVTIVVIPLVGLKDDMMNRCREAGIKATAWNRSTAISEAVRNQAVIVSVENVKEKNFRHLLAILQSTRRLARIVIDETHLIWDWAKFRSSMNEIQDIRRGNISCPLLVLSATIPPAWVEDLKMQFKCPFGLVRMPTVRENIRHEVEIREDIESEEDLLNVLWWLGSTQFRKYCSASEDRGIIFCRTRSHCELLHKLFTESAEKTQVSFYHAQLEAEEKTARMQDWQNGNIRIMCATSAFGTGIDFPSVRFVIHDSAACDSLLQYAQQSGRAGRDGKPSVATTLHCPMLPQIRSQIEDRAPMTFNDWIQLKTCRQMELYEFLDGEACPCSWDSAINPCDNCDNSDTSSIQEAEADYVDWDSTQSDDDWDKENENGNRQSENDGGNQRDGDGATSSGTRDDHGNRNAEQGRTNRRRIRGQGTYCTDNEMIESAVRVLERNEEDRLLSSKSAAAVTGVKLTDIQLLRVTLNDMGQYCAYCIVSGERKHDHKLTRCPTIRRDKGCLHCAGPGHWAKYCPVKNLWKRITDNCDMCGLPSHISKNDIHGDTFGTEDCPYGDAVMPTCMKICRENRDKLVEQGIMDNRITTDNEIATWMRYTRGTDNMVKILTWWTKEERRNK